NIDTVGLFKALAYDENINKDDYINNLINDIKNFKNNDLNIPNINAKLRDYQIDGLKWLNVLTKYNLGGILADDMGLGKTLEMISLFESNKDKKPILIICPKSLIFNWGSEISKFSPNTKCIKIYGSLNERHKIIKNIDNDERIIYITSYDSLRNDLELYKDILFNFLVLDEAQAIKNVNAIKSKNVKELNGIHKFALTGTPIENSVIDLWSIFDFILPKYLEDLNVFMAKYLNNKEYTKIISKKIAPFILRRTKKDVLNDLPEKYEHIISCDMSEKQRMIYDAHINDAKEKILNEEVFEMLPYLTVLREICVDPSLIDLNYFDMSGKLSYLNEMLPKYIKDGHKILIFSSFVKGLERISKLLDELNIKYFVLTGQTPIEVRNKETNIFNNNDNIKVYLISLKAGGTGLNLVGADTVIHLDPWWNSSAENQATDRAHRIGQQRNVEVIKLISSDSIEERVIELQNIKKDIINELINNDEKSITSITMDDIKFILG
ncbi:MAG: DEAD/DEAH box helicase, partial [Acholeplasmatales bacterium]|nr:DEAD/DEAH box helicase [Acholeplasmatales bacterium]